MSKSPVGMPIPRIGGRPIDPWQILNSLSDGLTIQNKSYTVLYQNQAMLTAFGHQVGKKCYAVYERRDAMCEGCGVARVFQTGEPVLVLRTAYDANGGTSYWENACFPIRDASGQIIAGAELCRNVTDRVGLEDEVKQRNLDMGRLNDQLQRQTAQLTETNRNLEREIQHRKRAEIELRFAQKMQAVGQLAAGIAHEINTPSQFVGDNLNFLAESFNNLLQLLAKYRGTIRDLQAHPELASLFDQLKTAERDFDLDYLEQNIPAAFEQASDGISRITTIVRAMKEFAHPNQAMMSLMDINRALQSTLIVAKNEYKYVADIDVELGPLPPVMCHFSDINQVFLNLLVNAAHAIADRVAGTDERGRIRLRTQQEGTMVRIDISDTGCGIPDNVRDHIFEPFFTTKEVGRGSGQGLAISRSIVEVKHGGSLTFESRVGEGTTFTIRLPVQGKPEKVAVLEEAGPSIP